MSTNDSASRHGRRPNPGEPWRNPERQPREQGWEQPPSGNRDNGTPYNDQRGRDNSSQHATYSGYTRPSYPPQRQEPAPPPQARPFDPAQTPYPHQNYDLPPHVQPGYEAGGPDELFTRESQPVYDSGPYPSNAAYRPELHDPAIRSPLAQPAAPRPSDADLYRPQAPNAAEDYGRGFANRIAPPDASGPRFFLPDERPPAPQHHQTPPFHQAAYPPAQPYYPAAPASHAPQHDAFEEQGGFDHRYESSEGWHGNEPAFHGEDHHGGRLPMAGHGDDLDEELFGDEEDFEHDGLHGSPKRSRKKLVIAAVAAALAAGGGAYVLKSSGGADKATLIRADGKPSKEVPNNPGGKQFPNGEKSIYERLRPDGTTQVASFTPPAAAISPAFAAPSPAGNSLEERIDEALKKAQRTGDAPSGAAQRTGTDQPTVVRSETYRPDGTRIDASRPVITPSIASVENGLPYPFGNAQAAAPASPPPAAAPAPFRTASAPPPQQFATAMAAPAPKAPATRAIAKPVPVAVEAPPPAPVAPAGAFYVSLKSAPDEKAIQKDLPALTDKYKTVLGEVQLTTKIADLGARGVTYRAVAGPLGSRQEAMDLCQKIKGVGGDKACFVTN
jgi:SPOR domain